MSRSKLPGLVAVMILGVLPALAQGNSPVGVFQFQKVGEAPEGRKGLFKFRFLDSNVGWAFDSTHLWKSSNAVKKWELLYPTTASSVRLKIEELHFVGPSAGWAITLSQLYRSDDGGRSWKESPLIPGLNPAEFRTLAFLDDGMHGWIAGGVYLPVKGGATSDLYPNDTISADQGSVLFAAIFSTKDGGATWQKTMFPRRVGRIYELHMLSVESGWALGDAGVFALKDGQWKPLHLDPSKCLTNELLAKLGFGKDPIDAAEPTAAAFPSNALGWIAFKNGFLIQTDDAGKTWCSNFKPRGLWPEESFNTFFDKVYFVNSKDGLAMGADQLIYSSSDGGLSWTKLYPVGESSDPVRDIFLLDDKTGWFATSTSVFQIRR